MLNRYFRCKCYHLQVKRLEPLGRTSISQQRNSRDEHNSKMCLCQAQSIRFFSTCFGDECFVRVDRDKLLHWCHQISATRFLGPRTYVGCHIFPQSFVRGKRERRQGKCRRTSKPVERGRPQGKKREKLAMNETLLLHEPQGLEKH